MARQPHSHALIDDMSSHIIPPRFAGNSADWHYPPIHSYSHGLGSLDRSKRRCPCGTPHQPMSTQSKRQCTYGFRQTPISVSSSNSDWSTSPQRLSTKDTAKDDLSGMTLKIKDTHGAHDLSEYWLQQPTQDESLRGCGSWQDDIQASDLMPGISSTELMILEPLRAEWHGSGVPRHSDGKS